MLRKKRFRYRYKTRHLFLGLLFGLIVVLTIGYAYLSQGLSLQGVLTATNDVWDVHFIGASLDTSSSVITCDDPNACSEMSVVNINNQNLTLSFSTKLMNVGDKVSFSIRIQNTGTMDVMMNQFVTTGVTNENQQYYQMSVTYLDGRAIQATHILQKNQLDDYLVTVDCLDELDTTTNFSVQFLFDIADQNATYRNIDPRERIVQLNQEGISISTTDHANELRFIGATPNNYVRFNNQYWRIVGVFDGYLKIVTEFPLSQGFSYDISPSDVNNGSGINQWGESFHRDGVTPYLGSDLMRLLNPGYDSVGDIDCVSTGKVCDGVTDYNSLLVNNSLYWNGEDGYCYNGGSSVLNNSWGAGIRLCEFHSEGLTSDAARNMIAEKEWYFGVFAPTWSVRATGYEDNFIAETLYQLERVDSGNWLVSNRADDVIRTSRWTGKVGLLYASDLVFSTGGGTFGRSVCLSKSAQGYDANWDGDPIVDSWSNEYTDCWADSWLNLINDGHCASKSNCNSSMVTALSTNHYTYGLWITYFAPSCDGFRGSWTTSSSYAKVKPTVYLKTNVVFNTIGDGSRNNPYQLVVEQS